MVFTDRAVEPPGSGDWGSASPEARYRNPAERRGIPSRAACRMKPVPEKRVSPATRAVREARVYVRAK